MQITLLKQHETPEGIFQAGETIDVSPETYKWLMEIYRSERLQEVEKETKAKSLLEKWKML